MGTTRTDLFSSRQNHTAVLLKALAHPARIAIVEYLAKVQSCVCGDIVDELPLAQPTVSQHLRELKAAGIIKGTIEGASVCYCLDESALEKIQDYFIHLRQKVRQNKCC